MASGSPLRILVIRTGNRARSQMAQGWLKHLSKGRIDVKSAGTQPTGVHPLAVKVMSEVGIDISGHTSDHVDRYAGDAFNLVLTVCDSALEQCLVFPGARRLIHQGFEDPDKRGFSESESLEIFRRIRKEVEAYCQGILTTELHC